MDERAIHNEMTDAPRDRRIEAWNGFFGWYETQFEDGEWPLRGDGKRGFWEGGVWYPVPSMWRDSQRRPKPVTRQLLRSYVQ